MGLGIAQSTPSPKTETWEQPSLQDAVTWIEGKDAMVLRASSRDHAFFVTVAIDDVGLQEAADDRWGEGRMIVSSWLRPVDPDTFERHTAL